LLVAVAVVAALCGSRSAARAKCAPSPIIVQPRGGPLPMHGDIYVFVPAGRGKQVSFSATQVNAQVPVRTVVLGKSEAWRILRVHVDARFAGPLVLTAFDPQGDLDHPQRWKFQVGAWTREDARYLSSATTASGRQCASTQAAILHFAGNAVAYRIEWGTDPEARAWIPAHTGDGEEGVAIGELGCVGWDVPPAVFGRARAARVVALFADGTEQDIATPPIALPVRAFRSVDADAARISREREPVPPPRRDLKPKMISLIPRAVLGMAVAMLGLGGALALIVARRRRARVMIA
jgi:hypothetical protein